MTYLILYIDYENKYTGMKLFEQTKHMNNNIIKTICLFSIYVISILSVTVKAQCHGDTIDIHWPEYISLDNYLIPFTQADTIVNEIILPIKNGSEQPFAQLLYPTEKILSIKDVYLEKEYTNGEDWIINGRKIIIPNNSKIPYLNNNELLFSKEKKGVSLPSKKEGSFVLFSEGQLFPSYQLSVTYIPNRKESNLSYPKTMGWKNDNNIEKTSLKLKKGHPLKIIFYGNSIEVGGNSSGFKGVKPYMPNWTQLVVYNLRKSFSSTISFKNKSVGGKTAKWGLENAQDLVANENPDLVVIAFGMNDGTAKVPPLDFISQIKGIMKTTRLRNPECEFIVVTPMLANPLSIHSQIQEDFRYPIWELSSKGVAIADVTVWHKWLLEHKSYQDMTGNNINHPNDYLARWYAHIVSEILIPEKTIIQQHTK